MDSAEQACNRSLGDAAILGEARRANVLNYNLDRDSSLAAVVLPLRDLPIQSFLSALVEAHHMPTRPWFPLNVGDYLRDTQHLKLEEHGAYFKLLCHAWNHDGIIPSDMRRIGQILGVHTNKAKTLWGFVGGYWYQTQGGYRQKRLDSELAKSVEISGKRRAAAEARHHANAPANAHTIHNPHSLGVPKEEEKRASAPPARKKGTRWEPGITPENEWQKWAVDQGIDERAVVLEAIKFADYWCAVPGVKGIKLDWYATWRNWIRRSNGNGRTTNGSGNSGNGRLSARDRVRAAYDKEFGESETRGTVVDADGWDIRPPMDE